MILIIGYYHRQNLGDDVFEYVWQQYLARHFPNKEYKIMNIDDVKTIEDNVELVLFGGGDLINDYFVPKLNRLRKESKKNIPYYAVSIGLPYPSLIDAGYLDNFDYIFHRNQTDQDRLLTKYSNYKVQWSPDLTYLLPKYTTNENSQYLPKSDLVGAKKIGVFLTRTIYNRDNIKAYREMVNQLAAFLLKLAQVTQPKSLFSSCRSTEIRPEFEIFLIPFCTDRNPNQNDRLINEDVYNQILKLGNNVNNVHLINTNLAPTDILPVFKQFYATICMRFHAHIFSLMSETPFLSIYSTRKVNNLLTETHLEDMSIKLLTDRNDFPISLDYEKILDKFQYIHDQYLQYKHELATLNNYYKNKIKTFEVSLTNLVFYKFRNYSTIGVDKLAYEKAKTIVERIFNTYNANKANIPEDLVNKIITTEGALRKYILKNMAYIFSDIHDNNKGCSFGGSLAPTYCSSCADLVKKEIIEIISYTLTGNRNSPYNYGLSNQIFKKKYNLIESCYWILNHYSRPIGLDDTLPNCGAADNVPELLQNNMKLAKRKINTMYINQNLLQGYHRSGWNYVTHHLNMLHNPNGIIFDNYLDKTFGWDCDFLTKIGTIPYNKDWMGVFHHTPNESYSINNLVTTFNQKSFINSLPFCKGIVVFSNYIKVWIITQLKNINITTIPVVCLFHPTEKVGKTALFNYKNYRNNKEKKIVQIGAWLRNSYAIYELPEIKNFQKCALKWKGMDNYFIDGSALQKLQRFAYSLGHGKENCSGHSVENCSGHSVENCSGIQVQTNCSGFLVDEKHANKYIVGMFEMIRRNHNSVQILELVPNEAYDILLSQNIVFIELVDASAVNTIIECIMRNTPILVNKIPATIEYLGPDYPLFYDSKYHAAKLISDDSNIRAATKYLANLNKDKFTIEYFINSLINCDAYKNIRCNGNDGDNVGTVDVNDIGEVQDVCVGDIEVIEGNVENAVDVFDTVNVLDAVNINDAVNAEDDNDADTPAIKII